MQIDKETVIKHRFWFLLPFVAIFVLVCWICVLGVRGAAVENYKKAESVNTQLKTIASTSKLKNDKWIDAMTQQSGTSEAKKEELWYREFNRQNDVVRESKDPLKGAIQSIGTQFITWPEVTKRRWEQINPGIDKNKKDFGEYLGIVPRDEYVAEYATQFQPVVSIIRDWLDESNPNRVEGAIRVPGRSLKHRENAMTELLKPWQLSKEQLIVSDEAWLLQEDLALKREIFKGLADLLDSYSRLKPEWSQVEYNEIKPAPAPTNAPAAPANSQAGLPTTPIVTPLPTSTAPATTPAPETTPAPAAPAKPSDEPPVYARLRFYNYVWPNLLDTETVEKDGKLAVATVERDLPNVAMYKGWRLDLFVGQDTRDENKLVLRGVSGNHSDVFTLPSDVQLAVWYNDPSGRPVATPILINDAGGVGPCEYWTNGTLKKVSEKPIKEIPMPANYGRISHVTRALPAGVVDQEIAFNDEWLINARLQRRENSPSITLTGEIINRSGRRLPAATFTSALMQPNDTRPMLEDFRVPTDAFNAGQRIRFQSEIQTPVLPNRIDYVQQKLNWRTTPIKRIERLEIGRLALNHSDRHKTLTLKPYDFKRKDPQGLNKDTVVVSAPAQQQQTGGEGDGVSFGQAGQGGQSKSGGASGGSGDGTTPNGFPTHRYIEVTPQLRRIPVALVMTVDSTAISDIIAAMSNSRLRFQVTMAPWVKVPNLGRPGGAAVASDTGGGNRPAAGGGDRAGAIGAGGGGGGGAMSTPPPAPGSGNISEGAGAGGGTQGKGGGAPPRFGPGGVPGTTGTLGGGGAGGASQPPAGRSLPAGSVGLEDDSSVVELQIYGVVTIYESPDALKRIQSTPPAAPSGSTPTK